VDARSNSNREPVALPAELHRRKALRSSMLGLEAKLLRSPAVHRFWALPASGIGEPGAKWPAYNWRSAARFPSIAEERSVFRSLGKRVRWLSPRLLILLLVPSQLLATLPQTVCICPDGRREPACPAARCGKRATVSRPCCGCACCLPVDSAEPGCCGGPRAADAPSVSRSGCRLALDTPLLAVVATEDAQPLAEELASTAEVAGTSSLTLHRSAGYELQAPTIGPPRDLPVLYRRLTI